MAEYEQQNMPYWSYNVKLKDALLQEGYMHPVLSDRGKNVFLYGGISALGEMIMVRCSKLTIAISWQRMCSTCIHLIVIRPPDDWCICGGLFLVRFSSWFFVSTTSVRMARTNLHIRATKNVIDANDKFFHFTLCILPVLSADPCPAQGAAGRLASFWACSSCCKILWGHAQLEELPVCWIWASAATRRAFYGRYDGTAGGLPAPCRPLEMLWTLQRLW